MDSNFLNARMAGYSYILGELDLTGIANWHTSLISDMGTSHIEIKNDSIEQIYTNQYWPGEKLTDHLEFAIKYDGVNLGLLRIIFEKIPVKELVSYIQSKPTGKYTRKIWFFYEFLTGENLPINDVTTGNYIPALDEMKYYTISNGEREKRYRIVNNLLGVRNFCPIIRKTEKLLKMDAANLKKKCDDLITSYPPELLHRALNYLYSKETKSSFEIERINPNVSRTEKFITALELAEKEDFCEKERLIELQNKIVDDRFSDDDYRIRQNYVGQTIFYQNEIIHFICPKPEDIHFLMEGLINSHKRMKKGGVSPVIHAAAIAYGFVFLHPFEDGNGRIHRFLIHNILSIQDMVPNGLMFPVSAVMLKNQMDYDRSLEAFSKPLLKVINYQLNNIGEMIVENDTINWYQYMDMTKQAESLYSFVEKTIKEELIEELSFLMNYDNTKRAIQEIVDMPDRLIDLFIKFCLQNNGELSGRKRDAYFNFLSSDEINEIERVIKEGYTQ